MNNINTLYCFGDSWAAGAELDFSKNERPFANLLADRLNCKLENYGQENMSLGLIVRSIALAASSITRDDLVLVVIPPDSRWYTEWQTVGYKRGMFLYLDKTNDWFQYHHQLFIFSICEMLNKLGCNYLLMHNYGEFPLEKGQYYFSNFYQEKFLSTQSLTGLLTETNGDKLKPIQAELSQPDMFRGPYFEGNQYHPNQKGHEKIAEIIAAKLKV